MRIAWRRLNVQKDAVDLYYHFVGASQVGVYLDSCGKGRYDIVAWNPLISRSLNHGGGWSPFAALDDLVAMVPLLDQLPDDAPPFLSGVIGYFSYEAAWDEEWIGEPKDRKDSLPDVSLMIPGKVIVLDQLKKESWMVVSTLKEDPEPEVERLVEKVKALQAAEPIHMGNVIEPMVAKTDRETYHKQLEQIHAYISRGDIYQANLSYEVEGKVQGDSFSLYRLLRETNAGRYAAYMKFPGYTILSSSPEQFIRQEKNLIETRPIKGTRPRGKTQEKDRDYKEELATSEKDQAELVMIVDLERNDLGRVCEIGSVNVPELFAINPHPTVWHQSARITGRLTEGVSIGEVLRMTFPGGSITGAPKIRSMQVIHELEGERRGIYTGSIGYVDPRGFSEWNIAIRTMVWVGEEIGRLSYRVGGGIVADSDPGLEYEETLAKGKGMLQAIDKWTTTPATRR
ncbi:para-aminobenzoate synthetase component 1 [Marininema halotolerans]|uniref:aminodeoxychorismate synthase n=1 Tax=Marininema halotolerans TaxID=1155944 RepID=A0A1I6SMV9_9BACL|nr:para-aminobenzoate synthetase component 1 [Marininema halotolerans]